MPQAKRASKRKPPGRVPPAGPSTQPGPPLPAVTLAKLEAGLLLVEEMVDEHTATFLRNGQIYKDRHREGSRRPLTVVETAQIAAGLGATLNDTQEQLQDAGLTAYDEPQGNEVLLAAGIATGTAFISTVKRLTALIEMSDDDLERASETGMLDDALDQATAQWARLPLNQVRVRASRAMAHFAEAAGFDSGKAMAHAAQAVWAGLWQAMSSLDASASTSSTLSAASTGGPAETSSTTPPGATSTT